MPQPDHEQDQAGAVAGKPQQAGCQHRPRRRPGRPDPQGQHQVGGAGCQPLAHGDEAGVSQRNLAGQIVVHTPGQAGTQHGKRRPPCITAPHCAVLSRPRQHGAADHDGQHPQRDPAVEILLEGKPSEQRRHHALCVQQQRHMCGGQPGQTQHQQDGPDHTSSHDGTDQPAALRGSKAHGWRPPQYPHRPQAQARAQVEQAGEQPGAGLSQQELGQGGAGAEQDGGSQCCSDAWLNRYLHGAGPMVVTARCSDCRRTAGWRPKACDALQTAAPATRTRRQTAHAVRPVHSDTPRPASDRAATPGSRSSMAF
eukprot:Opistho-1_new@63850